MTTITNCGRRLAEQIFAARMAAQLGGSGRDHRPDPNLAAVAKARTCEAVIPVTAFAHSVHGAMGITEDYNLQLYTRCLHQWRLDYGTESYWNRKIGKRLLKSDAGTVDFIRGQLMQKIA